MAYTAATTACVMIASMKRVHQGFTILELIIAIAILAILILLAVPSFRTIMQNNRAATITNDVVAALQTARSEALKRRQDVRVCRRNVAGTACDNGADWTPGWLIVDAAGNVIRAWNPPPGNPAVTGPNAGITYLRDGGVSAAGLFVVQLQPCAGDNRRQIDVNLAGRVNLARVACI